MRRSDLLKELRRVAKNRGERLVLSEGGKHTLARIGDRVQAIPRHTEINELTARAIIKEMSES